MARRISIQLVGDSRSLENAFDRAGKKGDQFQSRTSRLGGNLKTLGKAGAAGVAAAGVGLVTHTLVSGVKAAKEAEVAQARLRQSLKASGTSYARYGKQIDAAIDKTSRLAGIDDEELSESFSQLVRSTGSVTKATKGMNIATNIARARNISLTAATKAVEKAFLGSDTALRRVGIVIPKVSDAYDTLKEQENALKEQLEGTTGAEREAIEAKIETIKQSYAAAKASDKQATALGAIDKAQKKFAGSAEAYGKTAAGAQERFEVALENVQERIGAKLLPILTDLALWGVRFLDWSEKNWPRFRRAVQDAIDRLRPIIDGFRDYFESWIGVIKAIIDGDWPKVWSGLADGVKAQINIVAESLKLLAPKFYSAGIALGDSLAEGIAAGILPGLPGPVKRVVAEALKLQYGVTQAKVIRAVVGAAAKGGGGSPGPGASGGRTPAPAPGGAARHPGRARGGPVGSWSTQLVGERGPELLHMGQQSGYVQANGGGWGGGDVVVILDGKEIARHQISHQQRVARSTNASRRGPNAGTRLATT